MKSATRSGLWVFLWLTCGGNVIAAEPDGRQPVTEQAVERLIAELDANQFDVREAATAELIKIGDAAESKLASALAADPSNELKRRGKLILKKIGLDRIARNPISTDDLLVPLTSDHRRQFDQAAYEAKLQRLVSVLAQVTDNDQLALPVRWDQLHESLGDGSGESRALIVCDSLSTAFVRESIILADFAVDVSSASKCIIVARYGVNVSHCNDCIIIAGRSVNISHDDGGIVLCGGSCSVTFSQKSIFSAPKLSLASANEPRFINCDPAVARMNARNRNQPLRRLDTPGIVLSPPPSSGPLADKITVTFSLPTKSKQDDGFVLFQCGGLPSEYVVRVGNGLKNTDGKNLPGLDGWELQYSGGTFAIFSDGKQESCVDVARR